MKRVGSRDNGIVTKTHFLVHGLLWISIVCIMVGAPSCVSKDGQDGMRASKAIGSGTDADNWEATSKYKPVYSITLGSGEVVTQADYLAKRQPVFLFFFSPN